jgi:hypothetical protein
MDQEFFKKIKSDDAIIEISDKNAVNTPYLSENENNDILIRQELNIAKWPIFATSKFKGKERSFVRKVKIEDGTYEEQKIVIKSFDNVLRIFDYKVFCVLIRLWEESGRKVYDNVQFTFNKIITMLDLKKGKTTTQYIKQSLTRLKGVNIEWENNFYSNYQNIKKATISINILDTLSEFKRDNELYLGDSYFRFNKELLSNLINSYSKPLYLSDMLSLKKDISILLYNYLDLMLAKIIHFRKSTKRLFQDLDLPNYSGKFDRKRLLDPCLKELKNKRVSTGIITDCELVLNQYENDYDVIVYKKTVKQKANVPVLSPKNKEEINICLSYLQKKYPEQEFDLDSLSILIREHEVEKILNHILKMPKDRPSPIGFLKTSLEKNWVYPKTEEELIRERIAKNEQRIMKQKQKELEQRTNLQKEQQEYEKMKEYFQNLKEDVQESLKQEAIRKIEKATGKSYVENSSAFCFHQMSIENEIIEIIKENF